MALTGHSGMQTAQSMHSSGSMVRKFGPSRKQSTGQTSTQSVYLHLMHDSTTTCVILSAPSMARRRVVERAPRKVGILADGVRSPRLFSLSQQGYSDDHAS